jgi:N-methylhydantoinase A
MRIAIDTGGTFTDCVYQDAGGLRVLKIFSTPRNPAEAIVAAVAKIAGQSKKPLEIRHGTTVGTNTLLERSGARVAFVTTSGFEDTLAIGRQARPNLFDWFASPEPPLAPAERRFGVAERTLPDGTILESLDPSALPALVEAIRVSGAESVAVSLLFSFANSAHERAVGEALAVLGIPISLSHQILPEFREYERASTVAVNAYLAPRMSRYLGELESRITTDQAAARITTDQAAATVSVMQSSGGIVAAAIAAREPVRTILSGPAGGVVGAHHVAKLAGFDRIITFDMGGTSTDVALVDGTPAASHEAQVAGLPVGVPMLDIHTVGAGGGSLARFDSGGALRVGPQSAGADPGPICYGKGTEPTVTDANLILGRLDPERFLGGQASLDAARAREYCTRAKGSLSTVEEFATGIVRLADATMEKAIRLISVERGRDPRDYTLVSFGGAGGLHACALARALRIPRVLAPCMPGALSALGILISDVVKDYSRTVMAAPDSRDLEGHFRELEQRGREELRAEGLTGVASRSLDLRYKGQGFELNVPAGAKSVAAFHDAHRRRYGYADASRPVEVVNVRSRFVAASKPVKFPKHKLRRGDGRKAIVRRAAGVGFYDRELLAPGDVFHGPAVVVEYSATTVVPRGAAARVDAWGNIVIQV